MAHELRQAIVEAARELRLGPEMFALVPNDEAQVLVSQMLDRFVDRPDRTRWWEGFTQPSVSIPAPNGVGPLLLSLLPSSAEPLLLLTTPADSSGVSVFASTGSNIAAVIEHCPFFEYVVLDPAFAWLLCETHHGDLIAVGEPVRTRVAAISG